MVGLWPLTELEILSTTNDNSFVVLIQYQGWVEALGLGKLGDRTGHTSWEQQGWGSSWPASQGLRSATNAAKPTQRILPCSVMCER